MLSRLALRNARALPAAVRTAQVASSSSEPPLDISKLPRPVRLMHPLPVRFGFIPDSWFKFFYPKTGVTGPYAFFYGVLTYLLSKEIWVIEHNFYNGLSLVIVLWGGCKLFGPQVKEYLMKGQAEEVAEIEDARKSEIEQNQMMINHEKVLQFRSGAQEMVYDAFKVNIKMQLEATYRERLMQVYKEVKNRLDYHTQIESIERRLTHRHMSQWIINNVLKAITPEQEKATLQQCIKDLEALAAKA